MIPPIQFLIRIFKGNIQINNKNVILLRDFYPKDESPCITFDDSSSGSSIQKNIITILLPLPETNPYFKTEDAEKRFPQQVLQQKFTSKINVNIWANSSEDADSIVEQIKTILNQIITYDYHFCTKFDKETKICSTTGKECEALTILNHRTIMKQCPTPLENRYQNIVDFYHVLKKSLKYDVEYCLDDLDANEVLYRTVLPVELEYYTYYTLGGIPIDDLNINM